VNVAVIDTGIDLAHPDLNTVHGTNCAGAGPAQDDHGHGTHVAGTIGARNNGSGVVGVAPATKLHAVKVLGADGGGTLGNVICGIDWVTATRQDADPANDIAVANLSFGGPGPPVQACATTTDPLHRAICASTAAGVTYVVAAGNSGWDFDYPPVPDLPAAYPQVLTVTAMSDADGMPGGAGGSPGCASSEQDDRYATFSNYASTPSGQAHAIAAPGVCITSDWAGGGTVTISGTSMAAPHVAGHVALCISEAGVPGPCAGLAPAQVISKLLSDAQGFNTSNPGYGYQGDPLRQVAGRYYGFLTHVGLEGAPALPPPPPLPGPTPSVTPSTTLDSTSPTITAVSPDDASPVATSTRVSATFSEPMDRPTVEGAFSLRGPGGGQVEGVFSWSGETMIFTPQQALSEGTTYTARIGTAASDTEGNTVQEERTWTFTTTRPELEWGSPVRIAIERRAGRVRRGGIEDLKLDDDRYYEVSSSRRGRRGISSWHATFAGLPPAASELQVSFRGKASRAVKQTIAIWRWSSSSWVTLDARRVGRAEIAVHMTPAVAAEFVSGAGEVRIRVRAIGRARFSTSADLLAISARP
jgi:hypothetical protein